MIHIQLDGPFKKKSSSTITLFEKLLFTVMGAIAIFALYVFVVKS